ncbi:LysR family transcriptional regulator [Novosphingobium pokkalii]|uniref:LysR family transcriptional regulator n=1 Tax=Novosphingobium pokkalii TaxID=1770194 RepID=A0ABV7V884_9SPHN|nr:LysR family transcriptional regulator [Novosphingobium pokkalii]GHC96620.1 LysR family transcriptional regulator [Novosphingobium pokkalii]
MRFRGLDLNLLVAFDVLVELRHVTRAAEHLHVSQSAMSTILARLREAFADPILVMHGKTMVPTAYALQVRPEIRAILGQVEHLMAAASRFDPATSQRRFRIGCSDYVAMVVLGPFLRAIQAQAPHVRFEILAANDALLDGLERGAIDCVILPETGLSPNHPSDVLYAEEHVVQGWSGNPLFDRPLTVEALSGAGHVAVKLGQRQPRSFPEVQLQHLGIAHRIEVQVESFALAPPMLVGTDRIAIVAARLAAFYEELLPLRSVPLPVPFPAMRECVQWHGSRDQDAGLRWLIGSLQRFMAAAAAR